MLLELRALCELHWASVALSCCFGAFKPDNLKSTAGSCIIAHVNVKSFNSEELKIPEISLLQNEIFCAPPSLLKNNLVKKQFSSSQAIHGLVFTPSSTHFWLGYLYMRPLVSSNHPKTINKKFSWAVATSNRINCKDSHINLQKRWQDLGIFLQQKLKLT